MFLGPAGRGFVIVVSSGCRLNAGFKGVFQTQGAAHPRFGPDRFHPVGEGWDEAEILADMLLADPSNGKNASGRQCDRRAKDRLRHESAFGMMPQRAVPEIGDDLLRLVKPVMDALVVFDRAAPFANAGQRMMVGMCHDRLLRTSDER